MNIYEVVISEYKPLGGFGTQRRFASKGPNKNVEKIWQSKDGLWVYVKKEGNPSILGISISNVSLALFEELKEEKPKPLPEVKDEPKKPAATRRKTAPRKKASTK